MPFRPCDCLVFTIVIAVFAAAQNEVEILEYTNDVDLNGYNFRYRTSDGTERQEDGKFVNGTWTVYGMFSWIGPDGALQTTRFVADDQGYRILPEVTDRCSLPKDRGPCENYTVKWYFSTEFEGCARFWYGGCDGNENRYETLDECNSFCRIDGAGKGDVEYEEPAAGTTASLLSIGK